MRPTTIDLDLNIKLKRRLIEEDYNHLGKYVENPCYQVGNFFLL